MSENPFVGEKIAELRKKLKMTQDEFGDRIGVSRQAVASWEQGISMPKSDRILDICRTFEISSDYFYGYGINEETAATKASGAVSDEAVSVHSDRVRHDHYKLKVTAFILGWVISLLSIALIVIYSAYGKHSFHAFFIFIRDTYVAIMIIAICLTLLMTYITVKFILRKIKMKK